jgi:uncharacterized SAM-binding protein YcdF (DUF218 family)
MFVYLSKLLPLLIYPLGLASLIILLVLILGKPRHWPKGLLAVGLIILYLAGNRWVSYGLARTLEWRDLPPENMPSTEVIVLLGGGTEPGDPPRPMAEVNNAGDRVLYAAKLYREGAAPAILVSGGNVDFTSDRSSTPCRRNDRTTLAAGCAV